MKAAFSFSASIPFTFPSFEGVRSPFTSEAKGSALPSFMLGLYSTILGGGSGGEAVPDWGVLEPTA